MVLLNHGFDTSVRLTLTANVSFPRQQNMVLTNPDKMQAIFASES